MNDRDRLFAMIAPFIAFIVIIFLNIFVQIMIG